MNLVTAEGQKRIRRPISIVRRQFADMRHHAADRVHPDITYAVLSQAGERCDFTQEIRVLGLAQRDSVTQEWRDEALAAEVHEGTNKGMKILHFFEPDGEDATTVTVRIEAPATGVKFWLKPLFAMAVKRAIEKALEEDRIDLEERGYQPPAV